MRKLLLLVFFLVTCHLSLVTSAFGAVAVNALTNGKTSTDLNTYPTGSFTAGAGVNFAWIGNRKGTTPDVVSGFTQGGLTWDCSTYTAVDNTLRGTICRAVGPGTTGTGSIAFGGVTQTCAMWQIFEVTGIDTSAPIVQNSTAATLGNAATLSVTISAFNSASNPTFGFGACSVNEATTVQSGDGFTQIYQDNNSSDLISMLTEWKSSNDTTVGMDWTTATTNGVMFGLELKNNSASLVPVIDYFTRLMGAIWPFQFWELAS